MKPINVGLLGIGTVGGGTFNVLKRNQSEIQRRAGRGIRITAVADVFDALTHARPYKEAWPEDKAVDYITDLSGAQFDPQVVQAFLHVLADAGWRQGIAALGG